MASDFIERSVLGAILLSGGVTHEAVELRAEDFSLEANRLIFRRMMDLNATGHPIDILTLQEELGQHGELERIGGSEYLGSLTDGVPDQPSISHYVKMLRTVAERRRAAKLLEEGQRLSEDPTVPTSALAEVGITLAQMGSGASEILPPQFSEEALALRFSRKHANDLRYVARCGRWMCWDGTRWIEDDTLHVFDLARGICRAASAECGDSGKSAGVRLASKVTSAAVERLAEADRRHAATISQWDCDPWLLNTPTGTVDLRTGEIYKQRRNDYLTKITTAGPGADWPLWLRFIDRITGGDPDLQSFLQRMVGYALTGCTFEHSLFFLYGTGANGKSVFLSTISAVLGDYAKTAPGSTFTANATEQHPTDVAGLRGARFVTVIETEGGSRWAESKIKSLTGGDKIAVRFMRGDFFEFLPEFKLIIAGNHKPSLRSVDEAMRRRLHLIPFTVTIPPEERDPRLGDQLRGESAGILAWAIRGCLAWQKDGLNPPALIRDATADYLAAEDSIRQWLEDNCIQEASVWTAGAALFSNYQACCNKTGEQAMSKKRFTQELENRGFIHMRTAVSRGFSGIGLQVGMTNVTHPPVIGVTGARRRPI